jgi:ribosomal protein S18 acetylase RimI-like enzyme
MATVVPLEAALALYEKLGYKKIEELYCMAKELTQNFHTLDFSVLWLHSNTMIP